MLLEAISLSKSIGIKDLFHDLNVTVDSGEKIALIGRNGQGKTTLLKMLSGEDNDFGGIIKKRRNLVTTLTKQEHMTETDQTALEYILKSVPRYIECEKIMSEFENGNNTDISSYSQVLEYFTDHGYFHIKDKILNTLSDFEIPSDKSNKPLLSLSGGEKRYVELTRLMFSKADLYLIDEPTNHMDYLGKAQFIEWLKAESKSMMIVTHDRDVLKEVDKIIELKDKKFYVFNGNFDHYRKQNASETMGSVKLYQDQLNRLKEAKKRVEWGNRMRAKSKEWKIRYDHWLRDYEKIKAETVKPSFWIDQESTELLDKKVTDSYHKFKEKNISINIQADKNRVSNLLTIRQLSLGYEFPLFSNLYFTMRNNDHVFIKGRNGAGKSTLVRTILTLYKNQSLEARQFDGEIVLNPNLRIGEYEQEIGRQYLPYTLEEAVRLAYEAVGNPIDNTQIRSILAQYLFDPRVDGRQKIADLSGGQKARFQLIKMLSNKPNLLILDEPTNHLDLPSIEELEKSLSMFQGGILYISHDTYFINALGGETVEI